MTQIYLICILHNTDGYYGTNAEDVQIQRLPKKYPIRRQPSSKTNDERAAIGSSYVAAASGRMPAPARANGTKPWAWVLVRNGVG